MLKDLLITPSKWENAPLTTVALVLRAQSK